MKLAKPKTAAGWAAIVTGALALAVELAFIPAEASAITSAPASGPPVTNAPGPFYNQGDFIGFCVAVRGTGAVTYVEVNTDFGTLASPNPAARGNCAPDHVQAVFEADPSLYPVPAPSPTSSPAPTPTTTSSH